MEHLTQTLAWNVGGQEVLIFLFIVLLLFGGRKLPELARALGRSLSEFKRGKEDGQRDLLSDKKDPPEDKA